MLSCYMPFVMNECIYEYIYLKIRIGIILHRQSCFLLLKSLQIYIRSIPFVPLTLFGLDSKGSEQPLKVFKQWLTLTHWLLSHVDLILAHILCITHKDCIIQIFPHLLPSRP